MMKKYRFRNDYTLQCLARMFDDENKRQRLSLRREGEFLLHPRKLWPKEKKMKERERCVVCGEPTGKCGDDSLFEDGYGPLCEDCYESLAISSLGGGRDKEEEK